MIKLKKLYSEPEIFDPITFESGLNIILGEKSDNSEKTNAVGKSLCIEFISYCLLKKATDSRVTLIPKEILDRSLEVKLDLAINSYNLTIIRSIQFPELITIFKDNREIDFDTVDKASEYLSSLYFENYPSSIERISFRNLLAPIIRDERSEFKDIIRCFDTDKSNIPKDYRPHLFFFGFGLNKYSYTKTIIDTFDKKSKFLTETKKQLESKTQLRISDVKAKVNELEGKVNKLNESIDQLRNNESFESVQEDLSNLQAEIDQLRTKQQFAHYEIKQINSLPQPETITEVEIKILFNQFKQGLGDAIGKSIDEVRHFKDKIEGFRNTLINNRLVDLRRELFNINEQIRKREEKQNSLVSLISNSKDILKDYKNSIKIYLQENEELIDLKSKFNIYEKTEKDKKLLKKEKTDCINQLDELIQNNKNIMESFEKTILQIHEWVMDNREASFKIATFEKAKSKDFIEFEMRIRDDGSHSTNRLKVFIYDLALMFNENTKTNHPLFLVHDNIFDVDDDSLKKSLNFLYSKQKNSPEEFQYILTLNKDMVDTMEEKGELEFKVENFRRGATLTNSNKFLKVQYREQKRQSRK